MYVFCMVLKTLILTSLTLSFSLVFFPTVTDAETRPDSRGLRHSADPFGSGTRFSMDKLRFPKIFLKGFSAKSDNSTACQNFYRGLRRFRCISCAAKVLGVLLNRFWRVLEQSWNHLGAILDLQTNPGVILEPFWSHLGVILDLLSSILTTQCLRFRSRSCPKVIFEGCLEQNQGSGDA